MTDLELKTLRVFKRNAPGVTWNDALDAEGITDPVEREAVLKLAGESLTELAREWGGFPK